MQRSKFVLLFLFITRSIFAMDLSSNAFDNNHSIPIKYTCYGESVSPQLSWSNIPDGTKSFALIVDDTDAPLGTFTHWILYNLPSDTRSLDENVQQLPKGTKVGLNNWHKKEYGAPCPPTKNHHYHFKLYALNTFLDLPEKTTSKELQQAMKNNILAEAKLVGIYK